MLNKTIIFIIITFGLILSGPVNADRGIKITKAQKKSRIALIIGNSTYKSSPLKNPANDATDMAAALRKSGFDVTLRVDATLRVMEEAIRNFGPKLNRGGVGLFYYAGHGLQVKGRNYLIPVDAKIETESDVRYEAVDAGRVLGKMEDAENDLNIIILDACRNNPYARGFRSTERGLAKMDAPSGSILAYATGPGSVAADGIGENGLYTSMLLQHMLTPGLNIERVFKKTRIDVQKSSGKKQTPWESSSLTGDFYFVEEEKKTAPVIAPKAVIVLDEEEEFWKVVKDSTKGEYFEKYLAIYPDGRFAPIAQIKLDQMREKPQIAMITPQSQRKDTYSKELIGGDKGIVIDKENELMWQKYTDDTTFEYTAAIKYCEKLELGGHEDWILPSSYRLHKLVKKESSPAIDSNKFPNTKEAKYWTSSLGDTRGGEPERKVINFSNGYISATKDDLHQQYHVKNAHYTRCVRELD